MLTNGFYAGYMPKHIRKWLKDRQPHIPDQPDIPDQPTNITVNIPEPIQRSFEFNNDEQSIGISENEGYTIEGLFSATDVGEYTVTSIADTDGVVTKTVDMTLDEIKTKRIYDNITFTAK